MAFIPPIEDLTGKASDAFSADDKLEFIANFLPAVIDEGIGITESMGLFRDAGYTFTDSRYRDLFYTLSDSLTRAERIQYTNLDRVPSEGVFEESSINQPTRYKFLVSYTQIDSETGDKSGGSFWYFTDTLDTRTNMQNDAIDYLMEKYPILDLEYESPRFERAYMKS